MRAGVDIDGTITQMPGVFRTICRSLMATGHHVYIVTAAMPGEASEKTTESGRQEQLEQLRMLPGVHYDDIYLAWGDDRRRVAQAKRRICGDLLLDVMADNDPLNVAACSEVTNVLVPSENPRVYA